MNAKKTPLQQVNQEHGGKAKLVDKIVGLLDRGEEGADELKTRLLAASNQKLLRLMRVTDTIKSQYGSPAKLVEAVATAAGRAKDADYVKRLGRYTPAKLLDMARALAKRAGGAVKTAAPKATKKAAAKPTAEKPAAKKAAAKKPAAKKPAAKKPAAKKPAGGASKPKTKSKK